MIARLRGMLCERAPDHVVVDCGGVGYLVTVSLATLATLPEPGAEVTLLVYTQAQENRLALYGFAAAAERALFDLLITVKNVGPATAMGILSGVVGPGELARAIATRDLAALTRIRGIGKKTAEMLIVELSDKCARLLAEGALGAAVGGPVAAPRAGERSPLLVDVASALVNLGWRAAEAESVVARIEVTAGATVESLLREALRAMPR